MLFTNTPQVSRRCMGYITFTSRRYHESKFVNSLIPNRPVAGPLCNCLNVKPWAWQRSKCSLPQMLFDRQFSGSSVLNAQRTFELNTSPFGEIAITAHDGVETKILPIDPQKFPLQNKVFINVESPGNDEISSGDVHVSQEGATVHLTVNGRPDEKSKVICVARLPIKYDIGAVIKGKSTLSVEKFENEHVNIHCESGLCRLKNLQTGRVDIESRSGNIECEGVLQGNGNLKIIGDGDIKVHKIQGLTFKAETNTGRIDAKALYADYSNISTKEGCVHLGSCHRNTSVHVIETGNVHIDSLDGDISVNVGEGDVEIGYVAQHEKLNVETQKGDIEIKLSDKLKTYVNLSGSSVSLATEFDTLNDAEETMESDDTHMRGVIVGSAFDETGQSDLLEAASRTLTARTGKGNINIKCSDWISSLKLMSNLDSN